MLEDGSVVLVGTIEFGDFGAVKLDENGGLLWQWQVMDQPINYSTRESGCSPYQSNELWFEFPVLAVTVHAEGVMMDEINPRYFRLLACDLGSIREAGRRRTQDI